MAKPPPKKQNVLRFDPARFKEASDAVRKAGSMEIDSKKAEEMARKVLREQRRKRLEKKAEGALEEFREIAMEFNPETGFPKRARQRLRIVFARLPEKERRVFAKRVLDNQELPFEMRSLVFREFKAVTNAEKKKGVKV